VIGWIRNNFALGIALLALLVAGCGDPHPGVPRGARVIAAGSFGDTANLTRDPGVGTFYIYDADARTVTAQIDTAEHPQAYASLKPVPASDTSKHFAIYFVPKATQ
jgi:hypothetical protein